MYQTNVKDNECKRHIHGIYYLQNDHTCKYMYPKNKILMNKRRFNSIPEYDLKSQQIKLFSESSGIWP